MQVQVATIIQGRYSDLIGCRVQTGIVQSPHPTSRPLSEVNALRGGNLFDLYPIMDTGEIVIFVILGRTKWI